MRSVGQKLCLFFVWETCSFCCRWSSGDRRKCSYGLSAVRLEGRRRWLALTNAWAETRTGSWMFRGSDYYGAVPNAGPAGGDDWVSGGVSGSCCLRRANSEPSMLTRCLPCVELYSYGHGYVYRGKKRTTRRRGREWPVCMFPGCSLPGSVCLSLISS